MAGFSGKDSDRNDSALRSCKVAFRGHQASNPSLLASGGFCLPSPPASSQLLTCTLTRTYKCARTCTHHDRPQRQARDSRRQAYLRR